MAKRVHVDADLVQHCIVDLGRHGATGDTGVCRLVYSPEWVAAQDLYASWCAEAGLRVRRDTVGNVWGRLDGANGGTAIVTGSHVDSQRSAGRYDGALGVIAGYVALRALHEQFGAPRRPLECVSFCEEEGSRFPAANFWGSRATAGVIGSDEPESVRAFEGETIGEAMRAVGLDPARIPDARRDDIDTFLELHIEQGPLLEEAGLPVGIVTAIPGIRAYFIDLIGRQDHPGGVPMDRRRDAMAAAAEIITRAIAKAEALGRPALTTTGRILVDPNYPMFVPGKVTFSLDARHPDPGAFEELWRHHAEVVREVTARRQVGVTWTLKATHAPCPSDPATVTLLEDTARQLDIPTMRLTSGAVHDAMEMGKRFKMAMIFVRSEGGRSHTPVEFTSIPDAVAGIEVLAAALHRLAY